MNKLQRGPSWACQECGHKNDNDFIRCEKCNCSPFKFDYQKRIESIEADLERVKGDNERLRKLTPGAHVIQKNVRLAEDNAQLKEEIERLQGLIDNFCESQEWAVDSWKNQKHIKPLFDEWRSRKQVRE